MILIDTINENIVQKDLKLSVVLNADSFFYTWIQPETGLIRQLYGHDFNTVQSDQQWDPVVDNLLMAKNVDASSEDLINIGMDTAFFTIVPEEIYLEDEHAIYFKNICYLSPLDKILSLPLPHLKAKFLYVIDTYMLNRILTKWPKANLFHKAYPMLLKYEQMKQADDGDRIYIHVNSQRSHCAVYTGGKLQLFNPFRFDHADDFVYQVGLMYLTYGLDRSTAPLLLSGHLTRESVIVQDLLKYIYTIEFLDFDQSTAYLDMDKNRPPHFYYDLFALATCEL